MSVCPPPPPCAGIRQILNAALDLFAENGYEGVSVHNIAERAGVSKANVFHHFASKEALYLEVLRTASLEWGDDIAAVIDAPGNFSARLHALTSVVIRRLCDRPLQSRLMLREILENGALRGQQLSEEVFIRNFDLEMAIFRRAQTDGELRADLDPAMAWMMTLSACIFFFQSREVLRLNPVFRNYADAPDAYAEQICSTLLGGIARLPEADSTSPASGAGTDRPQRDH